MLECASVTIVHTYFYSMSYLIQYEHFFRNRGYKKPNNEDWTFVLSAIRDPKCFDAVMIFKIELQLYSGRIWSKWNLLMENDHNTL